MYCIDVKSEVDMLSKNEIEKLLAKVNDKLQERGKNGESLREVLL